MFQIIERDCLKDEAKKKIEQQENRSEEIFKRMKTKQRFGKL